MFQRMDEPEGRCTAESGGFDCRPSRLQAFFQGASLKCGTVHSYIAVCGHMNTVLTGVLTYSIFILH
ncbi:hypothetical protein SAMN05216411_10570 [Nitrosospira multiformis]|nr:hypothetical protein SAMN05216411_10570 [Nitrosospira multiformis]